MSYHNYLDAKLNEKKMFLLYQLFFFLLYCFNFTVNSVESNFGINYGVTENRNHGVFLSLGLQTTVNGLSLRILVNETTSFAELRTFFETTSQRDH